MEYSLFVKGLILGLSIAAPVGPIGILCIQRSLNESRLAGIISGLGAASADAIYASLAALGMTVVTSFLTTHVSIFKIIGGLILIILGIINFQKKSPEQSQTNIQPSNFISNFFTTFILTLSNPITIIFFIAIFSGVGLVDLKGRTLSASLLILGVFIGSTIWWIFLSTAVGSLRRKFKFSIMKWINKVSGLIIIGFGLTSLISLI